MWLSTAKHSRGLVAAGVKGAYLPRCGLCWRLCQEVLDVGGSGYWLLREQNVSDAAWREREPMDDAVAREDLLQRAGAAIALLGELAQAMQEQRQAGAVIRGSATRRLAAKLEAALAALQEACGMMQTAPADFAPLAERLRQADETKRRLRQEQRRGGRRLAR